MERHSPYVIWLNEKRNIYNKLSLHIHMMLILNGGIMDFFSFCFSVFSNIFHKEHVEICETYKGKLFKRFFK